MPNEKLTQLRRMAEKELFGNILPFWMNRVIDLESGGFYGVIKADGTPDKTADKNLILNARLVWTFAAAWRMFKKPEYLEYARRAYNYFTAHFIDREHGGCYYEVDCKGSPATDYKLTYGQSFAIYGLTEYARATGDMSALDEALAISALLEEHVRDFENGGYFEICARDWTLDSVNQYTPVNKHPGSVKTMNTHLHLLEAHTSLLRVHDDAQTRGLVAEFLSIMEDKVLNRSINHYGLYFDAEWKSLTSEVSFGHDIEGSWLMREAALELGDTAPLKRTEEICSKIAAACLAESVMPDGSMIYEYDTATGEYARRRTWWVQNEAVVGFLNAWEMTGDEKFLDASAACFEYSDKYLVDHHDGEWFMLIGEDGCTPVPGKVKVDGWKCPYHNSRMCFEIIERAEKALNDKKD